MFDLAQYFLQGEVQKYPFPHLVVENALPREDYDRLRYARPFWRQIAPIGWKPNHRYDLHATQLDGIWADFAAAATSKQFWEAIKNKFDIDIPGEVGVRGVDNTPIVMDCNVGINTPGLGRVRGPHVDNRKEIWAALWYMGEGGGGDLQIHRPIKELKWYGKREIEDECVEVVKTIPYKHNTFVCFLADNAIHGVTERTVAEPRYLVNLIAEYSGNN